MIKIPLILWLIQRWKSSNLKTWFWMRHTNKVTISIITISTRATLILNMIKILKWLLMSKIMLCSIQSMKLMDKIRDLQLNLAPKMIKLRMKLSFRKSLQSQKLNQFQIILTNGAHSNTWKEIQKAITILRRINRVISRKLTLFYIKM